MFIDYNLEFANGQALTGTSATNSTNIYDHGSAVKLFGGETARVKAYISVAAAGGTNPTFRAQLVGADSADLATNPVTLADTGVSATLATTTPPSGTPVKDANGNPAVFELRPSLQQTAKRYYGVIFTLGGTLPTATASAAIVAEGQSNLIQ